jgi:hypothetical protein
MVGALATVLACTSPSPLQNANLVGLREVVADVDATRSMDDVSALVDSHSSDQPIDCKAFETDETRDCHLTHVNARGVVRDRLESVGLAVSVQQVSDGVFSTEVLSADLAGVSAPAEIVLVGAHYDAFWMGADDNSSGVAAVLELARVLSSRKFDRTIRFVAFDLEELGLTGSTRYVSRLEDPSAIVATIVFDCVGFYDPRPGSQKGLAGFPVPDTGDFLAVIANDRSAQLATDVWALNDALGITKLGAVIAGGSGASPLTGQLMRSDHAPFWLAGMPALFLTDTADFRNPNYHTPTDTIDTLDAEFLRQVIAMSAAAVGYWAGGPR